MKRRWHLQLGPAYSASLGDRLESGIGAEFGIGVVIPIAGARFFIELDGIGQNDVIEFVTTDSNGNPTGTVGFTGNRSSLNIGLLF